MPPEPAPPEVRAALCRLGLLAPDEAVAFEALSGGVASDIWKVDAGGRAFCVKRALAKLKVMQDWRAPVGRNAAEVGWLRLAAGVVPDAVPEVLGHDPAAGLFAMEYLAPDRFPIWKQQLRQGIADPAVAEAVASRLVAIHRATAARPDLAAAFANDATFHAIRLEPYLEATARLHADLAPVLHALVARTLAERHALVHGDVSPKNILIGPAGPVFLDAECATYGDPAFDLTFCLNHLLLKCLWVPAAREGFLACFDALATRYLEGVAWEAPAAFEARAASLLPGLFLARIDGKSPVEYLATEPDKNRVRRVARGLLASPASRLAAVRAAWTEELRA
ncbi:MAG: aminoglycoside phosphotransferase family protein [Alphaproteobacteria bacterium]|nr:aminoglycoside phosphotransferase family protein [Alphaproteobacteria bacterium]